MFTRPRRSLGLAFIVGALLALGAANPADAGAAKRRASCSTVATAGSPTSSAGTRS